MTAELPPRPNAAAVRDALVWAELKSHTRLFSENFEGHLRSEVLHLRAELDARPDPAAELRRMADELDRWAQPDSVLPDPATVHVITARMRRRADELDGNHGGPDRTKIGG